ALIAWIVTMAKKFVGLVAGKAKQAFGWAFATTTFSDDEGKTHQIYLTESGTLTIASSPQAAREFLTWYVERAGDPKQLAAKILPLIEKAEKVASEISTAPSTKDGVPAPAKQKELLELTTQISAHLAQLVGADPEIGKLTEKYLLEGQV